MLLAHLKIDQEVGLIMNGKTHRRLRLVALIVLIVLQVPFAAIAASRYSPPGLYEVEQFKLPNGFRVLLKQRPEAHTVSLRLAVNIGFRHFDCERREVPRLIEHLLQSGSANHTDTEINSLIEEHGGTRNAKTGPRYTTYQIDIFDQYADLGISTLYESITDVSLSKEKIGLARDILAREIDGRPSLIRSIFYSQNIGKNAWTKAKEWLLPGNGAICRELVSVDSITDEDVIKTFRANYTPDNMTLIIVGNFAWQPVRDKIRNTFGKLPYHRVTKKKKKTVHTPPFPTDGPKQVAGTFAPFLGSSGHVAVAYRTAGSDSRDTAALEVLSSYLNATLYEQMRIKNGPFYSPLAAISLAPDYGILYINADSGLGQIETVSTLLHKTVEHVVTFMPTKEEIDRTKQRILLQRVQEYETNSGIADFYVSVLHRLNKEGRLNNYEHEIENVTPSIVAGVAKTYLRKDREIEIRDIPTLSYTSFYFWLGAATLSAVLIFYLAARKMFRENKPPWYRR
jgi:predicted Zn-dependent peptidase